SAGAGFDTGSRTAGSRPLTPVALKLQIFIPSLRLRLACQGCAGPVAFREACLNGERMDIRLLARSELPAPAAILARWLIGKTLVREHRRGRMSGRIVETEAYVVGDASGHAYNGKTVRNASLFLERGHAYVYFIYGCWFSLNVSAGRTGIGTGVL